MASLLWLILLALLAFWLSACHVNIDRKAPTATCSCAPPEEKR